MRLHRFFVHKPISQFKEAIIDERLIHQWRNVFRYNTGSRVVIFDGSGKEYIAEIEKLTNREAHLSIISEEEGIIPSKKVFIYQSLIKKDKMEFVIEKATELGASKIIPIISERSEKKGLNMDRARKIAIEASEQCGRANLPIIESSKQLVDSIKDCKGQIIVFDPFGSSSNSLLLHANYSLLSIFIGPEGGWSPKELEMFKENGADIYSLGCLTLRAETAAVAALAMLCIG